MVRIATAAALIGCVAGSAAASIIEDFEHGNTGLYTPITGTLNNFSITGAAAHDGQLGAQFNAGSGPRWFVRESVATAPGNEYYGFMRFSAGSSGRMYMGVGATLAGGAVGAVAATNTSQLLLQNFRPSFGFATLVAVPFTYTPDTWYRLAVEWAANGDMRAKLYDESGANLLADTGFNAAGALTPGGLAMRAFPSTSATSPAVISFDSFSVVPAPASLGVMALGGLVATRRRR